MSIFEHKIIDLIKIKNISSLSMAEQKNLAILIVAKNELSRLKEEDHDDIRKIIVNYKKLFFYIFKIKYDTM